MWRQLFWGSLSFDLSLFQYRLLMVVVMVTYSTISISNLIVVLFVLEHCYNILRDLLRDYEEWKEVEVSLKRIQVKTYFPLKTKQF